MKSLWNDAEAAGYPTEAGPRVYTSRLPDRDSTLALHGTAIPRSKREHSSPFARKRTSST